ncbi:MAG: hypothetical protein ACRENB_11730 [Gemmatimonadales bacterium]
MNPLVSFNRILGWVYVGIGIAVLAGWALTQSGIVLQIGLVLAAVGGLHLLAARAFAREHPWRWVAQAAPPALLLVQLLLAAR